MLELKQSRQLDPSVQHSSGKSKVALTISQSRPKRGLLSVTEPLHLVGTKFSQLGKPRRKRNKTFTFRTRNDKYHSYIYSGKTDSTFVGHLLYVRHLKYED